VLVDEKANGPDQLPQAAAMPIVGN
jgi:hypothetical protein